VAYVVNWRDPFTDVVHVVDYDGEYESEWSMGARAVKQGRKMKCGLVVNVTRDGLIKREDALIQLPWTHTRDHPTCLACVSGMSLVSGLIRYDAASQSFQVSANGGAYSALGADDTDEADDTKNDDPLDEGSET